VTLFPSGFRHSSAACRTLIGSLLSLMMGGILMIVLGVAAVVRPEVGAIFPLVLGLLVAVITICVGFELLKLSFALAWSQFDLDVTADRLVVTRTNWRPRQTTIPAADFGYTLVVRPMNVAGELAVLMNDGRHEQIAMSPDIEHLRVLAVGITKVLVAEADQSSRVAPAHYDLVNNLNDRKLIVPELPGKLQSPAS
jgi:hypothetical protein